MQLTPIQDQAIATRMALVVGGATFDRPFAGVRFGEVDGDESAGEHAAVQWSARLTDGLPG